MRISKLGNIKKQKVKVYSLAILIIVLFFNITGCSNAKKEATEGLALSSDYEITATLEPYSKRLEHTTTARVSNNGASSTRELYFHLYGNLFKTDTEYISVISVSDENGNSIPFELRDNEQLVLLTLNETLDVGEVATVIFSCIVTIPAMELIYGIAQNGEIHLSYFYPQLAVYGTNGWDTNPMNEILDGRHLESSDFRITIQVPSEYEIAANGTVVSNETSNGQTTYVFQAESRREIVLIAFTDFAHAERSVGNTKILGYINSKHSQVDIDRLMDAVVFSMEFYNRIYIEYPYETLIITNGGIPARGFGASMEYSGLFTVVMESAFEKTVFHEMAHQWFYALVGNDENVEPWLDEAFAEFSAMLCYEIFDADTAERYWEIQEIQSEQVKNFMNDAYVNISVAESANEDNPFLFHYIFYARGSLFLKELMDAIGRDEFLSILSEYCKTYTFKIATTQGFLSILRENTTVDIESIVDKYVDSHRVQA